MNDNITDQPPFSIYWYATCIVSIMLYTVHVSCFLHRLWIRW